MFAWGTFIAGGAIGLSIAGLCARVLARRARFRASAAEQRARSAERLAELGAMTSGLAHEIKNPLSTIGLNVQLLAEGVDDLPADRPIEPDVRQRLSRRLGSLRREVDRLRGILTDFLSYAGEMRLACKPADLNAAVEDLADFFLPQAEQSRVRLRTDLSPGSLMGELDVPHLKQAVLNLMLNGVQAMGPPGVIGAMRELILRTCRRDDTQPPTIELHVIDTGPGIPPGVLARLFTPYFTTKAGGSGLGLATARRIIEAHKGRIDVHTEQGKGTDFAMVLPMIAPASQV